MEYEILIEGVSYGFIIGFVAYFLGYALYKALDFFNF